ncbi:GNAT family N-acetyltransferase [Haloechinothrix sp. LS1_15]|uniref:GNAT family N-acetyltransferase n=1 Tax=Haloechinothrix sp. LS1_15 TaxID=2652248 RepID=UPI00294B0F83|nr:GNAT family N-acetyltransferase [Haloechinothrix sp. LS1_15]
MNGRSPGPLAGLRAAQARRFERLDPLLPRTAAVPEGELVTAVGPGDERACGTLYRAVHGPDSLESLWESRVVWEFSPVLGDSGSSGMRAALAALGRRLAHERDRKPAPDPGSGTGTGTGASTVAVDWPSRDVSVSPALHAHGFTPSTVLAVRPQDAPSEAVPGRALPPDGMSVRRATGDDVAQLVHLELAELRYARSVAGDYVPAGAERLLRAALAHALASTDPILVAEAGDRLLGHARCCWSSPAGNTAIAHRLREGRWGHIAVLSVAPDVRGRGVGRALVTAAHTELLTGAVRGSYLHYDPANPLSSVFWPRHGYRPVWTRWIASPETVIDRAG